MKSLLILLLISICAIAWRSEDIMNALSLAGSVKQASTVSAQSLTVSQGTQQRTQQQQQHVMSIDEMTKLNKTDPKAMQKFLQSRTVSERTEADKLMNFLAHGKYE